MKYVDEFRAGDLAEKLARQIASEASADRTYHFMEFCGGHTHAIFRYGVQDLMPENVHFVHGPGCPVCVLPVRRLDDAVELAEKHGAILCSYGDMMRVPGTKQRSLIKAKADDKTIVSDVYLAVICRPPSDAELKQGVDFLAKVGNRSEAAQDLMWALINSPSFLFNR